MFGPFKKQFNVYKVEFVPALLGLSLPGRGAPPGTSGAYPSLQVRLRQPCPPSPPGMPVLSLHRWRGLCFLPALLCPSEGPRRKEPPGGDSYPKDTPGCAAQPFELQSAHFYAFVFGLLFSLSIIDGNCAKTLSSFV